MNVAGELVGINSAVLAQDTETEGISFAIPVDLVRGVVEEIKQHGRVIRGWMGLQPDDLTDAERVAMGIEGNVGILLSEVYAGGPADIGNLRAGDAILQINGEQVSSQRQARLIVGTDWLAGRREIPYDGNRSGAPGRSGLVGYAADRRPELA